MADDFAWITVSAIEGSRGVHAPSLPAVVQVDNATLSFIDAEGAPWDLPTKSSVSDGSASPN